MLGGTDMQLRLFDEVHRCRAERHDYMTIFKTFRFVYRNALNGSFFLVLCRGSAIDRNLGDDAVVKMFLQRVDRKSVHIAGVNDLLEQ